MRGDELLEGDEPFAVGHHDEAGKDVGHLDPGDAGLVSRGVGDLDGEIQREVRDVRERMTGVDAERREHREHASLEHLIEVDPVVIVDVLEFREVHASELELG